MHLTLSTAPFSQSVSRFMASVEQKLSFLLPMASVDQESLDSPEGNNEMFNQEIIKTKPNGEGQIRIVRDRVYLLSAVNIFKSNFIQNLKLKSDWVSHWATLAFFPSYNY